MKYTRLGTSFTFVCDEFGNTYTAPLFREEATGQTVAIVSLQTMCEEYADILNDPTVEDVATFTHGESP